MDRGAQWATLHRVAQSQTRLSDFTLTFHFHALEKEMATHSSVLAWRIPGTEEPGGLLSMGSHRVGHDWSDLAAAAAGSLLGTFSRGSSQPRDRAQVSCIAGGFFLPAEPQGKPIWLTRLSKINHPTHKYAFFIFLNLLYFLYSNYILHFFCIFIVSPIGTEASWGWVCWFFIFFKTIPTA